MPSTRRDQRVMMWWGTTSFGVQAVDSILINESDSLERGNPIVSGYEYASFR
jgi:hypothetical protein